MASRSVWAVSGGASRAASTPLVVSARSRLAPAPCAVTVPESRGIFHSLSARLSPHPVAPPKLAMPIRLPFRSLCRVISFWAYILNGNLFIALATRTTSAQGARDFEFGRSELNVFQLASSSVSRHSCAEESIKSNRASEFARAENPDS